ncbi:MAG TPA: aminopeptidase [Methylomusa anaerophila]|uniref:Aminopeptidase PepS n=1 Tax=Methylomusa anaerophila TaxID=1930071 RepID=A0A348AG32_9FIRM|nr:aminopeptidase [Methylomusa anaerophila]BBB90030.1 aminopeptidase PepS [Methylomusa anaerophila]HML88242.1 aminopeptidase [Methylomusa anaerophila]
MDPRIKTLANNLIHYSIALQPGEKILIEVFDDAYPLAKALVDEVYAVGGVPFLELKNNQLQRALIRNATQKQLSSIASWEAARMKEMNAYIGVRASHNVSELADVPSDQLQKYSQYWMKPVHTDIRVPNTKWCVMRYPNPSMAQLANMSTEAFEDFYFNVCNLDYAKMAKAMDPLIDLMEHTDKVHIIGPGTDINFSIKDIPAIKCSGLRNIPDGEVYTAPVKNSVNGFLTYNTPAIYQGFTYDNIRLEFKNGKIMNASANDTEKINKVLDTDKGARFIGEFALGVNPHIDTPMKDTLFDEKIKGSFHFTPGNAYDVAFNGNKSAIHWDLVCIQNPEYGGGEIWFDDRLIRKDGRFIIPALEGLNPENLV